MSTDETKWKKKGKNNNNIPHVPDTPQNEDNISNDSVSALEELKNKIESIKNKRNGFTRLPNLEDIHTKQPDDLTTSEGEDNNVKTDENPTVEGLKSINSIVSNKQLVRYISIILAYIFIIISYLHIIFMNFKDEFMDPSDNSPPDEPLDGVETPFVKLIGQITILLTAKPNAEGYQKHAGKNKLLATLGFLCQIPLIKYIFLPAQAFIIIFDYLIESAGKDLKKETFEVGSLISIFLFSLISFSLSSVPEGLRGMGDSLTEGLLGGKGKGLGKLLEKGKGFELEKGKKLEKEMKKGLKKGLNKTKKNTIDKLSKMSWKDVMNGFRALYKALPLSYFILVGIVIFSLFAIDAVGDMRKDVAGFGIAGLIVYVFANIFMLSMSIVLSGFSAVVIIPYAIYCLMNPPDGAMSMSGLYIAILLVSIGALIGGAVTDDTTTLVTLSSLAIALMSTLHMFLEGDIYKKILKSHYKIPEFDFCATSIMGHFVKPFIKRFWNNKFMFGFMMIFVYICLDMHFRMDSGTNQLYLFYPGMISGLIFLLWVRYMYNGMPDTTFIADIYIYFKTLLSKSSETQPDPSNNVIIDNTQGGTGEDQQNHPPIETPVPSDNVPPNYAP